MTLEQAMKILGEGATKEQAKALVASVKEESKILAEAETKGLKDNQAKNLDQIKKLKGNQLPEGFDKKAFDTYIKDKDALAKKQKELDDKELEGKGQWEALKLKLNENHATAIAELKQGYEGQLGTLKTALDGELIENNALKAIEAAEGNSFFLMPHMIKNIKTIQGEDGKFSVVVTDEKGEPRLQDDATTPFEIKDLVAEMQSDSKFSPAFPNSNAGGGGDANAGGAGSAGINPWKTETKNITAQAAMNKNNPTLAAQMRKAAGVKEH